VIADFEQRLAEVLGGRLAPPFGGRVVVAPAPAPGAQPSVVVGVTHVEQLTTDLGSTRPEIAPGAADPRRVVRLRYTAAITVVPGEGEGRAQQLRGVDETLFALEAADLQGGSALLNGGDPGFFIQSLAVVGAEVPLDPTAADAPPLGVTIGGEGWFWPVGSVGDAGRQIGEVRIRGALVPLAVEPESPRLVAGGAPVTMTLRVGAVGPLRIDGPAPPALPFGSLALTLTAGGGKPGAGQLSGGTAGAGDVRLAAIADGAATIDYAPPAAPATDELVVGLDDGAGGLGVELGRVRLRVRSA
jgi:hypothetical protein